MGYQVAGLCRAAGEDECDIAAGAVLELVGGAADALAFEDAVVDLVDGDGVSNRFGVSDRFRLSDGDRRRKDSRCQERGDGEELHDGL